MKIKKILFFLLPAVLVCTCTIGQKISKVKSPTKVQISKDSTHFFSRFPQKRMPSRINVDSVKADYKRRTGREIDDRFFVYHFDSLSYRRKEDILKH